MTFALRSADKASAAGYIHACLRKIVFINRSLTLIMAESVAAGHHERGQLGFLEISWNVQRYSGLRRAVPYKYGQATRRAALSSKFQARSSTREEDLFIAALSEQMLPARCKTRRGGLMASCARRQLIIRDVCRFGHSIRDSHKKIEAFRTGLSKQLAAHVTGSARPVTTQSVGELARSQSQSLSLAKSCKSPIRPPSAVLCLPEPDPALSD
jgi:hypothetical protein